jgi:RimJ/RimL family protein N-acetyltransferase
MPAPRLIRALRHEDAAVFRELRLRALREDPIPFLASYEAEAAVTVQDVASKLRAGGVGTEVLGAFREGVLVGTLGFYRHGPIKARHRASLWGMYVAPEERRQGIGKALILEAISRLRDIGDVERVELTVVTGEHPARRLYFSLGFQVEGTLRRAMKTEGAYFDEELLVFWPRDLPAARE